MGKAIMTPVIKMTERLLVDETSIELVQAKLVHILTSEH